MWDLLEDMLAMWSAFVWVWSDPHAPIATEDDLVDDCYIEGHVPIAPPLSRQARLIVLPELLPSPLSSDDVERWTRWAHIFALDDIGHTTTSHGSW